MEEALPSPSVQPTPTEFETADHKLQDYYDFGHLEGIDYVQGFREVQGRKVWGYRKVTRYDWDPSWDGKSE
jgi:hypothetical protein